VNIRKSLLSTAAAIGLMVSVAAPMVLADDTTTNNSTNAVVEVIPAAGVFDVKFCAASTNLSVGTQPNASPGSATGTLSICYEDTKVDREAFTVAMSAGDFTNGANVIDSSNFRVVRLYNLGQYQWGNSGSTHNVCDGHNHGYTGCTETVPPANGDIGDIGYIYDSGATTPQNVTGGIPRTTNNSLETGSNVHFGYAGVGTISSLGNVDVKLTIPGGTPGGQYTSNVTLSVTMGSMP
jgi:hypothetical protein